MGNEISHKRFCRRSRKSEGQATEQKKAGADLSAAQKSLLGNSENPLPKEESQDAAEEMKNKETASSSLQCTPKSVPQVTVQTTELQDLGETQQEPEEVETEPVTIMNPDTITYAPSQEGTAAAQPAARDAGVTKTGPPLQAAGEAEDVVVVSQAAVEECSVVCKKPSGKLCKPSPLCRWLKKLKSSAEKK